MCCHQKCQDSALIPFGGRKILATSLQAQPGTQGVWESPQAKSCLGPLEKMDSLWFLTPGAYWGHRGKEQLRKRNLWNKFHLKKKHGSQFLKIKHERQLIFFHCFSSSPICCWNVISYQLFLPVNIHQYQANTNSWGKREQAQQSRASGSQGKRCLKMFHAPQSQRRTGSSDSTHVLNHPGHRESPCLWSGVNTISETRNSSQTWVNNKDCAWWWWFLIPTLPADANGNTPLSIFHSLYSNSLK